MKLLLPQPTIGRLFDALRHARSRETGGVLVGEHLHSDTFRLAALSVQPSGGSAHRFEREPKYHEAFLAQFLDQTGHAYTRYNYLGEWHSHPYAPAVPSFKDRSTMQELVDDPKVGVNFAVLLITRLNERRKLQLSAHVFLPGDVTQPVALVTEASDDEARISRVDAAAKRFWIRLV